MYRLRVSEWFQRNGKFVQFLEMVYRRQKWSQFKRHSIGILRWSLTSWILQNWVKQRKQHSPRIGSRTDHKGWNFRTWRWPPLQEQHHAVIQKTRLRMFSTLFKKCESLGSGKQLILHGNSSAIARIFHRICQFFDVIFLPNMQFECCMILQGTLKGKCDIVAASGESTAWVLLWKTRSRPIGVRVCLVDQFNIFSTAVDPRARGHWLCLWKKFWDVSSSWSHLRTKVEMKPIIHLHRLKLSSMILKFPLVHKVHKFRRLLNLISRLVFRQDSLQVHHQQVYRKSWNRKYLAWAIASASATFTAWA